MENQHLENLLLIGEKILKKEYALNKSPQNICKDLSKGPIYLTYRESEVIKLRYGLQEERIYTLREIGQKFNLTRERIRQIETKALRKLRHYAISSRKR